MRGYVERVAATDSYALLWVGEWTVHVPLERVLAVARPHFHEPAWGDRPAAPPRREVREMPAGQMALFGALAGELEPDGSRRAALAVRRARGKRRSVGR